MGVLARRQNRNGFNGERSCTVYMCVCDPCHLKKENEKYSDNSKQLKIKCVMLHARLQGCKVASYDGYAIQINYTTQTG